MSVFFLKERIGGDMLFGAGPEWEGFGTGLIMGAGDSLERARNSNSNPNPNLKSRMEKIGKIRRKKDTQEANQRLLDDLKKKTEYKHRLFVSRVEKNLRSMCKKVKFFDFMAALLEEVTHSEQRGFGFAHRLHLYSQKNNPETYIHLRLGNHFFAFKEADSLELEVGLSTKEPNSWLFVETVFPLPEYLPVNGHYGIGKKVAEDMLSILQQLADPKSAIKFLEKNLSTFTGEIRKVDFSLDI